MRRHEAGARALTDADLDAWLKVPPGKLGTERMVPIDDDTLALVDRLAHAMPAHQAGHCRTRGPADRPSPSATAWSADLCDGAPQRTLASRRHRRPARGGTGINSSTSTPPHWK